MIVIAVVRLAQIGRVENISDLSNFIVRETANPGELPNHFRVRSIIETVGFVWSYDALNPSKAVGAKLFNDLVADLDHGQLFLTACIPDVGERSLNDIPGHPFLQTWIPRLLEHPYHGQHIGSCQIRSDLTTSLHCQLRGPHRRDFIWMLSA